MKICQKAIRIFSLEKDDKRNITKMQMRVWSLDNRTTMLVSFFKHDSNADKTIWDGHRTGEQVVDLILTFLRKIELIKKEENWDCNFGLEKDFFAQDPPFDFENDSYTFLLFKVKEELLRCF